MNKLQLKEYLETKFDIVLSNDKHQDRIDFNKQSLNITPSTHDDKCYVTIADFICMNNKKEKFYFCFYSKKNTTMFLDSKTKTISIKLENNVTKRNLYDSLFRKIKKDLLLSKSFIVFYTVGNILDNGSKKIIIVNDETLDIVLNKFYDK